MNWYVKVLKQYVDFDGRARRREYWIFAVFNMIFSFLAVIFDNIFDIAIRGIGYGPIYLVYALVVFLPSLGVSVRRLHDVGKSGWYLFISLIPIIGSIWLLVLFCTDSQEGKNDYGENPKQETLDSPLITDNTADMIILLIIVWWFINRSLWVIMPNIMGDLYSKFNGFSSFLSLIGAITPIGLAFIVKNKTKQIVLFVIAGIYFLYFGFEILKSSMM